MTDEWVPFSHRYGFVSKEHADAWGGEPWRSRHSRFNERDPESPLFRCICPGPPERPQCADRASQEDRLCDTCRKECVSVDDLGRYYRMVDLYEATA